MVVRPLLTIIGIVVWLVGTVLYRAYLDRRCLTEFGFRIKDILNYEWEEGNYIKISNLDTHYTFGFVWPFWVVCDLTAFLFNLVLGWVEKMEDFLVNWGREPLEEKPGNYRKNYD